jgi:hypothetical protein
MTSSPITDEADWLVRQLEAWPNRIDPEKTTNIEYLMKEAAKRLRSSAPPVMGMEEMVETMRCKACEMAVIWEKDGGPTCACIETEWEVGKGQMPWEEGYADRAVKVLPLSTPLVTGRDEQGGANAADAAPGSHAPHSKPAAFRPSGFDPISQGEVK